MIIIKKTHNNYCSVGVMELCLLNFLILIDCFLCNSYSCVLLRACYMLLTRNHIFICEIWGKFQKVNLVNLSKISLLNL